MFIMLFINAVLRVVVVAVVVGWNHATEITWAVISGKKNGNVKGKGGKKGD